MRFGMLPVNEQRVSRSLAPRGEVWGARVRSGEESLSLISLAVASTCSILSSNDEDSCGARGSMHHPGMSIRELVME